MRWDVTTNDYIPRSLGGPTPAELVAEVLSKAHGGSIVVLHLNGPSTLAALPGIVSGLRAKGLEPVTLQRLLRLH